MTNQVAQSLRSMLQTHHFDPNQKRLIEDAIDALEINGTASHTGSGDRPMGHILEQAIQNWLDNTSPCLEPSLCIRGGVANRCIKCDKQMFQTALAEHLRSGIDDPKPDFDTPELM